MNRILKTIILSAAVAATTLSVLPAANARDWRHNGGHYGGWHHHSNNGGAIAAGVLGLAAGAVIGGALSQPRYYDDGGDYVVRDPRPRPAPVREYYAGGGLEPWSPAWYRYCSGRYRSFDARSGTFTGYDGDQHFCTAN